MRQTRQTTARPYRLPLTGEMVWLMAWASVAVTINGQITLKFVVDSGAADVSVPADVVLTLVRTGTLTGDDFLGKRTYTMADGSR